VTSLDLLSKYLFIKEFRFDAMLRSNFGHVNSYVGHIKSSRFLNKISNFKIFLTLLYAYGINFL